MESLRTTLIRLVRTSQPHLAILNLSVMCFQIQTPFSRSIPVGVMSLVRRISDGSNDSIILNKYTHFAYSLKIERCVSRLMARSLRRSLLQQSMSAKCVSSLFFSHFSSRLEWQQERALIRGMSHRNVHTLKTRNKSCIQER